MRQGPTAFQTTTSKNAIDDAKCTHALENRLAQQGGLHIAPSPSMVIGRVAVWIVKHPLTGCLFFQIATKRDVERVDGPDDIWVSQVTAILISFIVQVIKNNIMSNVDQALETQIKNIEAKTGKSLAELTKHIINSPLTKHSELRDMVKNDFGLGYGDANTLVHLAKRMVDGDEGEKPTSEIVGGIYTGKKEALIPLHNGVMQAIEKLGDFEIAPKKTYLSLRRKKQFATVGPGSKGRVEIGLNMKGLEGTSRLEALPPGRMCQYRIYLSELSDIDDELMGWIGVAYDSAG